MNHSPRSTEPGSSGVETGGLLSYHLHSSLSVAVRNLFSSLSPQPLRFIQARSISAVSGYTVCGLYPSQSANETVFDPRLTHWISTFYAIAVIQSAMTTGLMAYKLWQIDRRTAGSRVASGNLFPVLRILVESASLQFVVETILLALYAANYNAQYILLEIVTPLVVSSPVYLPFNFLFPLSPSILISTIGLG